MERAQNSCCSGLLGLRPVVVIAIENSRTTLDGFFLRGLKKEKGGSPHVHAQEPASHETHSRTQGAECVFMLLPH